MQRLTLPIIAAAIALTAGVGCSSGGINTDPTLFVTATANNPTANVTKVAAGTSVTGGFTIALHLGARASGSADVSLNSFQVTTSDKKTVVIDSLPLKAVGVTLPITLEPGDDEDLKLEIDLGSKVLTSDEGTKLCAFSSPSSVIFTGSLNDTLRGGALPVDSEVITVTGCTF
ncbi:MAG: hypothetical protein U0441_35460 [Polyangiaceae bacterium]